MRALLLASTLLTFAIAPAAESESTRATPAVLALAPTPEGKLTGVAAPSGYRLDLTVDPDKESFSGRVEIDTELKRPAKFIDLHGRDLAMKRATVAFAGRTLTGHWSQLEDTGVARLEFDEELPAGKVTLRFDYEASFQSAPAGMFRVKVGDDWYSWTQFESIDGRAAFPSFDEPGFKTPFTVTLRTKPGIVAVSNASEKSVTRENGMDVHRFDPTLPLPTYLVAMMVGPFATLSGTVPASPQRAKPLPIRIVTTKNNAARMEFALAGTKGIVRNLENYFGQAFPYPKLDQITSPIMPGAMENAGADLYADSILILDKNGSTEDKRRFGMVVSHELAHQWFGDLVTPAWWDDIWLNESFANWMGYRIGNEWRPDLNIKAGALEEGFSAMSTDSLLAGRAIHQNIDRNVQIDEAFDSITYGKGGHVVAMIAGYMGDTKFRDGVRRYMAAHKYGNATSTDFFGAMAQAAGDPRIIPAMQSFTDQQGVPLVTFAADGKGGYTVTQGRYARLGTTAPATRWGIPLCVRRSAQPTCQLLTEATGKVTLRGKGALVPNAGGTGYYRFELPQAEWDALIARADTLPGGEALAVADSLFASFRAGRAEASQIVTLAQVLARSKDSYASDAGISNLEALQYWGLLDDAGKAGLHRLIETIYRPQLAKFGFTSRAGAYAGEAPERSQQRLQVLGRLVDTARDPALRKVLADAATAYLGGDTAALDPELFGMAFSAWLDQAGLDGAKRLADKALASQDGDFRRPALGVLAGSGNPAIAKWLLEEFKDERLRRGERNAFIGGVIGEGATRDYGYTWLKRNLDGMLAGSNGIFFAARLPGIVGGFCGTDQADELGAALRPRFSGKTGALDLERTIERVRTCGQLRDARGAETSRQLAALK